MSWRLIFAILVAAAGLSVWGGLQLGNWLVAHGPLAPAVNERVDAAQVPVLDADGRPYLAQPPQPLVDGRLAVPEPPTEIAWQIPEKSLDETKSNQVIAVATDSITMVEAEQIANNSHTRLAGIADVGNLMANAQRPPSNQPLQPIEPPPASVAVTTSSPVGTRGTWQASLRQDLQACSAESFFDRPSCAWAARNKYCTPNNAWGKVDDCPARNF